MEEFKVNDFITLKLEDGKTNIYINGKLFNHCKYILMRKTVNELEAFLENIESVDELAENLDDSLEVVESEIINIPDTFYLKKFSRRGTSKFSRRGTSKFSRRRDFNSTPNPSK